jgi:hypothetical protein
MFSHHHRSRLQEKEGSPIEATSHGKEICHQMDVRSSGEKRTTFQMKVESLLSQL